ncbi:hypothetical protein EU528_14380 [Candidatus Thorarchaeota archaeon]|nr:MAG: hypothetical protein EU528_14380 [Candidatus Thorarchaeota archaeon]
MMISRPHNSIRIWTEKVDETITLALATVDEDCFVVEKIDGYIVVCDHAMSHLPLVLWVLDEIECNIVGIATMRYSNVDDEPPDDPQIPESFASVFKTISTIASTVSQFVTNASRDEM